ncbi:hypothetical protein [Maritimibacter sp. HL-12]|jgi:cbb3-type cytochrome oxidase subunit 1|uniref:hypothetical protein n=1 Tax=Maritimibacter sp. HL-12 TaxID=1162418 RepID=UPI000A0F16E0|nr:hypothetical protein [Maritimibacter sp. HL-12]SMH43241.1 hypothetical protein SAMN05661107_1395 [Maritimibacter sp. HL-12]
MKGIAFWFFLVAVLSVAIGMAWGIQMSASGNHALSGAHAHLNLVGWASLGLFGIYYHMVPEAAEKPLAKVHFAVAVAGVVVMVPGIALAITERGDMLAIIGSLLTFASILIFLYTVARHRTA